MTANTNATDTAGAAADADDDALPNANARAHDAPRRVLCVRMRMVVRIMMLMRVVTRMRLRMQMRRLMLSADDGATATAISKCGFEGQCGCESESIQGR